MLYLLSPETDNYVTFTRTPSEGHIRSLKCFAITETLNKGLSATKCGYNAGLQTQCPSLTDSIPIRPQLNQLLALLIRNGQIGG